MHTCEMAERHTEKWLAAHLGTSAVVLCGTALAAEGKALYTCLFVLFVLCLVFLSEQVMENIVFVNNIILMWGWRYGRGREGREDSTVGRASGSGQLTKADREGNFEQGVGTQRR